MIRRCVLLALLTLAFGPLRANAQTVHGRVLDTAGHPLPVALLTLLDAEGRAVRTGLSGERGAFTMQAPAPGRYRLRVEQIGFEAHLTAPFDLDDGAPHTLSIAVAVQPIQLGAIFAEAASRCTVEPRDGSTIARLWAEARKALHITAAAESGGFMSLEGVRYVRELDAAARRQRSVRSRVRFSTSGPPFDSPRPAVFARVGFVLRDAGEALYFGPSASVLLSDAFLERHCFRRTVVDRTDPARIGLTFEPVPGSTTAGLAGTLWIDRASAAVTTVDYSYREPDRRPPYDTTGRLEFGRLPNGVPFVSRWWIRMPMLAQTPGADAAFRLTGVLEEGGIVVDASGSAINADDQTLAAVLAAEPDHGRFAEQVLDRPAIDAIVAGGGTIDDLVRALGPAIRVQRGEFWSYDHDVEEMLCVELARPRTQPLPITAGRPIRRQGPFCASLEVVRAGALLEKPGVALGSSDAAQYARVELLGAQLATQRYGMSFDGPVIVLHPR